MDLKQAFKEAKETFKGAIPEIKRELGTLAHRFRNASRPAKLALSALAATFVCASLGFSPENVSPTTALAAQILSLGGCIIAYTSQRLEHNKHHMVVLGMGTALLSASSFMLDDPSYGILMTFGAARRFVLAATPNQMEHIKTRIGLATAFGIAGGATMSATGSLETGWDYTNLASMLVATVANALPSGKDTEDMSHTSRLLILTTMINNTVYQLRRLNNYPAILFGGIATLNQLDTMDKKDVPNIDKGGKKLLWRKRWGRYIRSGFRRNKMLKGGMKIDHPEPAGV